MSNRQLDDTVVFDSPDSARQRPAGVVAAPPREYSDSSLEYLNETVGVLAERLRLVALLLCGGFVCFLILEIVLYGLNATTHGVPIVAAHIAVIFITGMVGLRLCTDCKVIKRHLRFAEVAVFGGTAIYFTLITLSVLRRSAENGYVEPVNGPWILLIFTYALFVPNTWRRALAVIAPMVLIPTGLTLYYELTNEAFRAALANSDFSDRTLFTFVPLTFGATIAVWGVHSIRSLRREAFRAKQLGQYHLKQLVGAGGMGEVYVAEHTLLKRPCAIKLIRPEKAGNPTALARFEREVQATAKLSHWNTIDIYDYGRHEDGTFYYVMEYLLGMSLQSLLDKYGALPPGRVVYLLTQTCDGLHEAHSAGLVHRDIKPANIFAAKKGHAYDIAKLLDFGLVRASDGQDELMLTQAHTITGSPLYMSPEQATSQSVDARSDIYSVGCVAYSLLTGRPPFQAGNPIQVIVAHTTQTPPAPHEIDPNVPVDVSNIIMQCLEKDPADRYDSALELKQALQGCSVCDEWDAEMASEWWTCHGCQDKKRLDESVMQGAFSLDFVSA